MEMTAHFQPKIQNLKSKIVSAPQLKEGDFGRAAVAYGENDRAEPACHVYLRFTLAAQAFEQTASWATRGAAL